MRATVMYGAGDVRVENVPDPMLQAPTDALARVLRSCICGSDPVTGLLDASLRAGAGGWGMSSSASQGGRRDAWSREELRRIGQAEELRAT